MKMSNGEWKSSYYGSDSPTVPEQGHFPNKDISRTKKMLEIFLKPKLPFFEPKFLKTKICFFWAKICLVMSIRFQLKKILL